MSRLQVEFLVEPFSEGSPGQHVKAAVAEFEQRGLKVEIGPFGNTAEGEATEVLDALRAGLDAAVKAGATRVNVSLAAGGIDG